MVKCATGPSGCVVKGDSVERLYFVYKYRSSPGVIYPPRSGTHYSMLLHMFVENSVLFKKKYNISYLLDDVCTRMEVTTPLSSLSPFAVSSIWCSICRRQGPRNHLLATGNMFGMNAHAYVCLHAM